MTTSSSLIDSRTSSSWSFELARDVDVGTNAREGYADCLAQVLGVGGHRLDDLELKDLRELLSDGVRALEHAATASADFVDNLVVNGLGWAGHGPYAHGSASDIGPQHA